MYFPYNIVHLKYIIRKKLLDIIAIKILKRKLRDAKYFKRRSSSCLNFENHRHMPKRLSSNQVLKRV